MTVFYMVLFGTFPFTLLARLNKKFNNDGRPELLLSIIAIIAITLVAGLRNGIGDTGAYKHFYKIVGEAPTMSLAIENAKDSYESGFTALFWILNQISQDPQIMIFVCALITTVLNLWTIRKYSKCFELEIFMYIASGFYLVTMNGIRQCLAAAILFWATKYIIEGKFIKYLITVLLMYTIHGTALVMIPVYFIVRCESWSETTMKIIAISAVALICFQPLMNKFFEASEGTKYEAYENTMATEGGANPLRTVIAAMPVVAAYIYRDKIKKGWPESNIFINMSLICLIISVFSMINWIFNRYNIYFQAYSFILFPYIVKNCFIDKQKKLVYFGFIVCFFIFFYYEHVLSLGVNYTSDFINF